MNNCENCKYSTSRICNQCMNHLTCSHGKADLCKKCAEKCIEQSKDINYEQDHSHIHCWNQGTSPACGQKIKHLRCCLCVMKSPEVKDILALQAKEIEREIGNLDADSFDKMPNVFKGEILSILKKYHAE